MPDFVAARDGKEACSLVNPGCILKICNASVKLSTPSVDWCWKAVGESDRVSVVH